MIIRRVLFSVLLLPVFFQAQNTLLQNINKLPAQLRYNFINDHLKDLLKKDSATARKETLQLLEHFKNDSSIFAMLLTHRASQMNRLKLNDEAIVVQTKAMGIFERLGDLEKEMAALNKLSVYYNAQREGNKITAIFFEKLKKAEGNEKKEAALFLRIGVQFKDQINNYDKALYYLERAAERFKHFTAYDEQMINDQVSIDKNIGVLYRQKKQFDKALYHFNKALAFCDLHHKTEYKAVVLNSMGILYTETGDFRKAIQALEESIKIKEGVNDIVGVSTTKGNLADLYLKINNFNKAEEYALDSYHLAVKAASQRKIMEACMCVYSIYDRRNKTAQAFPFLKRAFGLKDSLYKVSVAEQTSELEARYDSDKKRKEIELSNLKNQQLQRTVETNKRERTMILLGSSVLLLLLIFAIRSYLGKRRSNFLLEDKNKLIVHQKLMVEEQHKEILDSITYAKRLQDAILPPKTELDRELKDYFIYYHPKAIVAGDFYWMEAFNDQVLIAVADCTGHGVPGAMVSLVCSNALNRSVYECGLREPGSILDKTRELVLENFAKSESDVKDGMDISLMSINKHTREVKWAGANNPLWYISEGTFKEVVANKQPIGKADQYLPFTTHSLTLAKGDCLFLFSDGYADQFGGPKGKKLKYKQMQEVLAEAAQFSFAETLQKVSKRFEDWKGELEQVDDVCVIGIRI